MALITQSEAARVLGVKPSAISCDLKKDPLQNYFIEVDRKIMIDDSHPDWLKRIEKRKNRGAESVAGDYRRSITQKLKRAAAGGRYFRGELREQILVRDNYTCKECGFHSPTGAGLDVDHIVEFADGGKTTLDNGQTLCHKCNQEKHDIKPKTKTETPKIETETTDLQRQAAESILLSTIASARIKEEKAKQEEIRTAEIKKELAPISLVKYYFSFSENLLQRLYRRPHEIEPQLEALFLAREGKKATQLIVRELESIVVQCKQELEKAISDEGYRVK